MNRSCIALLRTAAVVLLALTIAPQAARAQQTEGGEAQGGGGEPAGVLGYDPYPPGILPPNLPSEIERVRREVNLIFQQALVEMQEVGPITRVGQPPTIQGSGYRAVQTLGKLMNFDENMSPFRNRACAFCHMPYAGFSGPIPSVNLTMVAYPGSLAYRAGKRTAQRYTYAPWFPVLGRSESQGLFFGGNFWDSRATGYLVQSPDADQSQHPPVDTQEMALPDTACIAYRLSQAQYRSFYEAVWGRDTLNINFPMPDTERICDTPGGAAQFGTNTEPIPLLPEDRTRATTVYTRWAESLDAYERGREISPFTSKFDAFLKGTYTLTADEMAGYRLFDGKGNCNSCHVDGRGTALNPKTQFDNTNTASTRPVFTCFGSANEGLPLNPRDAIYYQTTPDFFGFIANSFGFGYRDLGMGTFLRSGPGAAPNPNDNWTQYAPMTDGQFQVSTARDVAMAPPQCSGGTEAPGPYFQKAFFHNGYIKSLKQLVHFYNTRDVFPYPVTSGHCPAGTTEKVDCWPMPEVRNNIDCTTGALGLTSHEEDLIVIFLKTLTDGFTVPFPNIDTFTGTCMTGGDASTQGNGFLIPTPPLPPCASAICNVPPLPNPPIDCPDCGPFCTHMPPPPSASNSLFPIPGTE